MATQHGELVPYRLGVATNIARIAEPGDGAQRELLAPAGDHDRRVRLLVRLGFQDRVLGAEIPAVERRALFRP
jgi:hypothetical protein